jgi:probable lipoprotein NlpC
MMDFKKVNIDQKDWLQSTFAFVKMELPLIRNPIPNFESLPFEVKDKLVQVFVTKNEIIQVLGIHESFLLVRKRDGVMGWIQNQYLEHDSSINDFLKITSKAQLPVDFLNEWSGVPYRWGGVSKSGIDCSGFTQAYFFDVLGVEIPKNSQDQRKQGAPIQIAEIQNHDLIFCQRKNLNPINHVGVFYQHQVHHAQLERGVISESLDDFIEKYAIKEIKRLLSSGRS